MKNNKIRKPILVTGIHRSGTTFMGRMLSLDKQILYLWEPFQAGLKEKSNYGIFEYWFSYLEGQELLEDFKKFIYKYSRLHFSDVKDLKTRNMHKLKYRSNIVKRKIFNQLKINTYRYLFKDPISVLSTEWLYNNFQGLKVVLLIRNPVDFINSIKYRKWNLDFIDMYNQRSLMEKLPDKYISQVEDYLSDRVDIINKGILMWNIIYNQVLKWRDTYNHKWYFVRLEDLSNNIALFKDIYNFCELEYNTKIKNDILLYDSKFWARNTHLDKKFLLSEKEIGKIKDETYDIASRFNYFLD